VKEGNVGLDDALAKRIPDLSSQKKGDLKRDPEAHQCNRKSIRKRIVLRTQGGVQEGSAHSAIKLDTVERKPPSTREQITSPIRPRENRFHVVKKVSADRTLQHKTVRTTDGRKGVTTRRRERKAAGRSARQKYEKRKKP